MKTIITSLIILFVLVGISIADPSPRMDFAICL